MYKNVCHKIIVYFLVGCLSFCVPATTYYKSVHAFEWVGGALAFEEALKWLLAIVGVTAAGSVASQVDWSDVREQCVEVQLHNGASQAQVSEWWAKIARGTLDKASSCWSSFLEWSDSLVDSSSSGGVGTVPVSSRFGDVLPWVFNEYGINFTGSINSSLADTLVSCFIVYYDSVNSISFIFLKDNGNTYSIDNSSSGFRINRVSGSANTYYFKSFGYTINSTYSGSFKSGFQSSFASGYGIGSDEFINDSSHKFLLYGFNNVTISYDYNDIMDNSGSVSSDWQSAIDVARENLNLLNRDLPDENESEVAIPMPGLADSDNEASADAYDNIIDAINDGTITLDDGIAQIQDLLHVLVIDNTTDIVQPVRPDPDTGEDQTKDDVIKENKSNMGFTLAGLEKVFPFCIPFDIYAFMTLLVAEPVAPEFDFPIKSVNNQTEEIHIDLSPFQPVAVVVRYIFDFLFIIGLALMTRSLIGGGSSD